MNILMIGNSFSICVGKNLPQIVNASKKHQLTLTSAFIGGCSLETHADHLRSNEKDISFSPYLISEWDSLDAGIEKQREGNVLELLKNNRYDVISIQQASHLSWDYSSYQPYAGKIISCIRKFNPDAKIIIQQTWSYRNDSPRFAEWGFDADEMFKRARAAYHSFAADQNFEIIPTGDAVDIYRKRSERVFKKLSENGAKVMLSNSDPHNADPNDNFFDDLYQDFNITRVDAARMINSKGASRGKIKELRIKNY